MERRVRGQRQRRDRVEYGQEKRRLTSGGRGGGRVSVPVGVGRTGVGGELAEGGVL